MSVEAGEAAKEKQKISRDDSIDIGGTLSAPPGAGDIKLDMFVGSDAEFSERATLQ
eukprot:CAMPEP_0182598284 /NCGR_PEP_ID=MMETSP1324-20130603/87901_1 /TAXON_ID=236786 /ORGANISM="Florenciella sp., Strain RCC1587" /LENGTH=55 /DNA_ID=CAMNT_0024816107 /DNA_START=10 /DNA_END=174 /DNA_ORIENTATION=-